MTPDFVDLRRDMTTAEALMRIRCQSLDRETVYESYVIDDERHLLVPSPSKTWCWHPQR
jgi:magnesium transporter